MKKVIALSSLALSALFAFNLALAEDNSRSGYGTDSSTQQPGTSGTTDTTTGSTTTGSTTSDSAMSGSTSTSSTQAMLDEELKNAKTCTSESTGKTYKRGQTGFKSCQQEYRRKHEQMGGTMGRDSDSSMSGSDSSMSGSTGSGSGMSGGSSDTGTTDSSSSR
ncbi:MAG: hypothetical protein NDJ89_13880 [Oligoflexia bacterium]|nr:hypothetical protein [Oligoflexia bacterium]